MTRATTTLRYDALPATLAAGATRTWTVGEGGPAALLPAAQPARGAGRPGRGHARRPPGGGVVPAGTAHEEVAERLLGQPGTAFLQVRNVVFGCYLLTVRRSVRA